MQRGRRAAIEMANASDGSVRSRRKRKPLTTFIDSLISRTDEEGELSVNPSMNSFKKE